ncbi:MAG: aldehyde dehydrogenase family protein [Deltaproteobacteria bacterium]|nr:aldehyde dehydrogenase family protein [Deltaproteobacteria bacterium]MBW2415071.1 aldehyde dehydrogenase family protein [Deltaproteobacteria bacterium]
MADRSPFDPRGDFIDGSFSLPDRPTGEIALEDPGDLRAPLGAFPFARDSVDTAVAAARRAWPAWRDLPAGERATFLERFARALDDDREALALVIAREAGKPLWEARTEVGAMISKVEITLGEGLDRLGERAFDAGGGRTARWRAHARGVLAVLGPFNFPGHLVHGHVVPALATGNCVVIKPSERTPATGQLYADLAARAGMPRGVFNLVQGDGACGGELAAHPDVDGVLFTGSWSVGRRILEATLDQPQKIVALEMGGKNAALVCADAELDGAAEQIAFGACVTAGQRCSATSRIIVDSAQADALCEKLVDLFQGIRVGYPLDGDVFMGPVISNASAERHGQVMAWAADEGAQVLVAGGPCEGPRAGHYVRPSLHRLARLDPDTRYQREEHFVPDAAVLVVDSLDEAIAALNATGYGLVASVFSSDRGAYEQVWRESRVGLLNWNTSTVGASSRLPFGGQGQSGNDRPAGATAVDYCTFPVASLEAEVPEHGLAQPGFRGPEKP